MPSEQLQQLYTLFFRWCELCPEQNEEWPRAELVIDAHHAGRLHDAYEVDLATWDTPDEGITHLQSLVERAERMVGHKEKHL